VRDNKWSQIRSNTIPLTLLTSDAKGRMRSKRTVIAADENWQVRFVMEHSVVLRITDDKATAQWVRGAQEGICRLSDPVWGALRART